MSPIDESKRSLPINEVSRRAFLGRSVMGLGGMALAGLSSGGWRNLMRQVDPAAAKAKHIILLFMSGGPSQFELFDEKPLLTEHWGEELPKSVHKNQRITGVTLKQGTLPVVGSVFKFKNYGECGMRMSELLPHLGGRADDITLVRSMKTDFILHDAASACLMTGTGANLNRPSWGSWVAYGLGSENENLPEYVVMLSGSNRGMPLHSRLWSSGFLPNRFGGVQFRSGGDPVLYVKNPPGVSGDVRREILDGVKKLNEIEAARIGTPDIRERIHSYEMAARMQLSVPELTDISKESKETLKLYGADPGKPSFANNMLLARRLVERGVRFVQLCDRGWDTHFNIPRALKKKCEEIDRPCAALIEDLKKRGLFDETLIIWAGEFGRTSYCEGPLTRETYGRDHSDRVGSMWMAGGGLKGGTTIGVTDDWGWEIAEKPVHVHDIQATVLHCMGIDHTKLTYRFKGRDFRLTDTGGRVVREILA